MGYSMHIPTCNIYHYIWTYTHARIHPCLEWMKKAHSIPFPILHQHATWLDVRYVTEKSDEKQTKPGISALRNVNQREVLYMQCLICRRWFRSRGGLTVHRCQSDAACRQWLCSTLQGCVTVSQQWRNRNRNMQWSSLLPTELHVALQLQAFLYLTHTPCCHQYLNYMFVFYW